jgi:hypothetical protein
VTGPVPPRHALQLGAPGPAEIQGDHSLVHATLRTSYLGVRYSTSSREGANKPLPQLIRERATARLAEGSADVNAS